MINLDTNIVTEIAELTDHNQHMAAALVLACQMTTNNALEAQLDLMCFIDDQTAFGYNRNFAESYKILKSLLSEAQTTFTNADEIYAAF